MQKIKLFHHFALDNKFLKQNPAILLAKSILTHISGTIAQLDHSQVTLPCHYQKIS